MKKLVLSFFLLSILSLVLTAKSDIFKQLELKRVRSDLFSITSNDRCVFVGGNGGVILRSTDMGINWEQIQIDDKYSVMDLLNYGYDYGVLDKNYIIKSYDKGKTWEMHDIGNYSFHRILPYNNLLYCLGEKKIVVSNLAMEKIKEYDIVIGKINGNPSNNIGDQYNFEIVNDKIYYVSDTTELTEIDLKNDKTRKIDLTKYGKINKNNNRVPSNLFKIGHTLYFSLHTNLYSFENNKVQLIFKGLSRGVWATKNNEIFNLSRIYLSSYNRDSISFIKVLPNNNSQKINDGINDRYISNTIFAKIKFLTNKIIIAVGKDKLIYMSFDSGKTWVLKSHLDLRWASRIYRIDDKHAYFVGQYAKFVHTTDEGTTWLPQKNYYNIFTKEIRFSDTKNWGTELFMNNKFGLAYYHTEVENDTNFVYTNDGGETVILKNSNNGIGYGCPSIQFKKYSLFKNKNKLLFSFNGYLDFNATPWPFSFIYEFDKKMERKRRYFLDSAHFVCIGTFFDNNLYALILKYSNPENISNRQWKYNLKLALIQSLDTGKSWTTLREFDFFKRKIIYNNIQLLYTSKTDKEIFFHYLDNNGNATVYMIDIVEKKLHKIVKYPENYIPGSYGIQKIANKYYFRAIRFHNKPRWIESKLYMNDDIVNQPSNWHLVSPTRYTQLSIIASTDSLFYIRAYDSLFKRPVMWFAKLKKISGIDENIETKGTMYIGEPVPNPASNLVSLNVSFDLNYKIEQADINVYDVLGNHISSKEQFNIQRRNNHSISVIWNTAAIPPGVYFLSVRLGGETITKSLVIYR